MTVPHLKKWKWPKFHVYRDPHFGWQFFLDINPDHNPILIVSWWRRELYVRAFERTLISRDFA